MSSDESESSHSEMEQINETESEESTSATEQEDEEEENNATKNGDEIESSSNYTWWIILTIVAAILVSFIPDYSNFTSTFRSDCLRDGERLFDKATLAKYKDGDKIYLAFLGVVYDVSDSKHYRPDGGYRFFTGIDGTRAFLNGKFDEEHLRDDVLDLDDSYLSGLDQWSDFYDSKYKRMGVLIGSYYDSQGCPKKENEILERRLQNLKNNEMSEKDEQKAYPPCNFEWSAATKKGRLWCSKSSGGIERSWVGVPRNMWSRITKQWRCACLQNGDHDIQDQLCDENEKNRNDSKTKKRSKRTGVKYANEPECTFKHYPNCNLESIECEYT